MLPHQGIFSYIIIATTFAFIVLFVVPLSALKITKFISLTRIIFIGVHMHTPEICNIGLYFVTFTALKVYFNNYIFFSKNIIDYIALVKFY